MKGRKREKRDSQSPSFFGEGEKPVNNGEPLFFTVETLCSKMNIGRVFVMNECKLFRVTRGKEGLPHCRIGRRFFFSPHLVGKWIADKSSRVYA